MALTDRYSGFHRRQRVGERRPASWVSSPSQRDFSKVRYGV